ncbi:pyrokinin-1 receptor [Caerostris extrusa]|uniref:Pyrokinin-1 receptor n=1 Tax=Caerostris extrusa TaxID=172846 RepID=A0AAV4N6Q0_CAEEX|nr:pyrokinin-1 receptor [Caerostris extrusa]
MTMEECRLDRKGIRCQLCHTNDVGLQSHLLMTGVTGNICTCIVITRNRYMHTATNYYLFNLAVSDLMLLILGLPAELYQLWYKYPYIFGEPFCILRGLTSEMSTNASILTITMFYHRALCCNLSPVSSPDHVPLAKSCQDHLDMDRCRCVRLAHCPTVWHLI